MPDVAIGPVGNPDLRPQNKLVPSYLVELQLGNKKQNFIAVKYEEFTHGTKCVGFFTDAHTDEVVANYADMIRAATVEQHIEVMFPWGRILDTRSLMYRHKAKVQ